MHRLPIPARKVTCKAELVCEMNQNVEHGSGSDRLEKQSRWKMKPPTPKMNVKIVKRCQRYFKIKARIKSLLHVLDSG